MKLINLFETSLADIRKAIDDHLVMLGGDTDVVIISDVPLISEPQYQRLYRMSFKDRSNSNMDPDWGVESDVDISPVFYSVGNYKKWFAHLGSEGDRVTYLTMKWNEFVKHAKENYPGEDDDDFSE